MQKHNLISVTEGQIRLAHRVPGSRVVRPGTVIPHEGPLVRSETAHWNAGFEIGWDCARLGVDPEGRLDDSVLSIRDGYAAGRVHFGAPVNFANLYERKWLRLRISAHRRNRVFDPSVTPALIEAIAVPFCPVMRTRLQYHPCDGPLDDASVWSIDRIDNERAYVDGNLMVMSQRANEAKDRMGFDELREMTLEASRRPGKEVDGLGEAHWSRLTSIAAMSVHGSRFAEVATVPRLCFLYGALRTQHPIVVLQQELMYFLYQHNCSRKPDAWVARFPGKKLQKLAREFGMALLFAAGRRLRAMKLGRQDLIAQRMWAVEDAWCEPCVMPSWIKLAKELDHDTLCGMVKGGIVSDHDTAAYMVASAQSTGGYLPMPQAA